MSLLGRLLGRADEDTPLEDEDAAPETAENDLPTNGGRSRRRHRDTGDPYEPEADHAALLSRTRARAEADAVRHAEDMLGRIFTIHTEAESTAEGRLAELRVAMIARDTELHERKVGCEREIGAAATQLAASEAALRRAGVPADEVGLGPLRNRRFGSWKLFAGIAIGAATGYLIFRSDLGTPGLAVVIAAALGLAALIFFVSPEEVEERRLTALRESRAGEVETVVELNSEVARIDIEREALRGQTFAVAENEIAFAGQLAAAYVNAAFSAMPAGSLENGREFMEQPQPEVEMPSWAAVLEPEQ